MLNMRFTNDHATNPEVYRPNDFLPSLFSEMDWDTTATEWQVEFGRRNIKVRDLEIVTSETIKDTFEFLLITITKFIVRPWLLVFGYFADLIRFSLWQSGQYPEPLALINSCFEHPYVFFFEWMSDLVTSVMVFLSLLMMIFLFVVRPFLQ